MDEKLALFEIFGGQPRPWSMTGATQRLAKVLKAPRQAFSLDRGFELSEDIFDPQLLNAIRVVLQAGLVDVLWIATPCESVSVMWTRHGQHPFRSRSEPDGRSDMPQHWRNYASMHNAFFSVTKQLAIWQHSAGKTFFIENVTDVGNPKSPYFQYSKRHHVPLWITSWLRSLATLVKLSWATTEMGGWLGRFCKPTTICGGGPRASAYLERVNEVRSVASAHTLRATDVKPDGTNWSREAGQYPQLFCAYAAATWLLEWRMEPLGRPKYMVLKQERVAAFLAPFAAGADRLAAGADLFAGGVDQLEVAPTEQPKAATTLERWWQGEQEIAAAASAADQACYEVEQAVPAAWQSAHESLPSQWLERTDVVAEHVGVARETPLPFVSRRRAMPESAEVLAKRPLPRPSRMVDSAAKPYYQACESWPHSWPPRPVKAEQVWLDGVYDDMLEAIAAAQALCKEGAAGKVMDKFEPRVYPTSLMVSWARSHVEAGGAIDNENPNDIRPLQPYSEADPVPQTVNAAFFTRWAAQLGWTDHEMIRQVTVSGVEAQSACTKSCIIMGHHGGLRRHYAEADKLIAEDTVRGFTRPGRAHPWTFPFIATSRNCVERKVWKLIGEKLKQVIKWRVTTDDSIAIDEEVSRNDGIDPERWHRTGLPLPQTLAEAVAIVKAIAKSMGIVASQAVLEQIAVWALDLTHAYRMLSVQRAEWGQQCYVWHDGMRLDLRCLFGTASMVEFFQCVSFFVLSIARKRIREFDAQHPYSDAREAWRRWRAAHVPPTDGEPNDVCSTAYIYLDDGLGLTPVGLDEQLQGRANAAEQPVQISLHVERQIDGTFTVAMLTFAQLSRPQSHLQIAKHTFSQAGWHVVDEKVQLGLEIDELGLHCATPGDGSLTMPEAKRRGMIEDIKAQQPAPIGTLQPQGRVSREEMDKLVGRCGHLAQVAPEANAYMAPMHRMLHAKVTVMTKGRRRLRMQRTQYDVSNESPVAVDYQRSLRWWRHALEAQISVPLAPQLTFPALGEQGVGFMFTDAAREEGTGHGAFTMIKAADRLVFVCIDPRWPQDVLHALQTNVLSMPAGEGIGAVVFADVMARVLPGLTHLYIFTDSTAVVAAINSNNSESPQMNMIVRWLFDRQPNLQLIAIHQPGKRNNSADGLSRSESQRVEREAAESRASVMCVTCDAVMLELAHAAMGMPQCM